MQRGVTDVKGNATVNVTISAVNLAKSFVVANTPGGFGSAACPTSFGAARLTTATNLAVVGSVGSPFTGVAAPCFWEVVEFF